MAENNSEDFRARIRERAKGTCECEMDCGHHSKKRCGAQLRGSWEVHKLTPSRGYIPSNVVAMCQTCHRNTPSYGKGSRQG